MCRTRSGVCIFGCGRSGLDTRSTLAGTPSARSIRNVPGLDLPDIDFVKIAQGLGCDAVRVAKSSELEPALTRGLSHKGVSLIEVMVDSSVPLLYAERGRV